MNTVGRRAIAVASATAFSVSVLASCTSPDVKAHTYDVHNEGTVITSTGFAQSTGAHEEVLSVDPEITLVRYEVEFCNSECAWVAISEDDYNLIEPGDFITLSHNTVEDGLWILEQ